jgi:large subunit ribosomal protein L3
MPQRNRPRKGSKAFYPRKRARRIYPRTVSWPGSKEIKPLGFAGYKAGMSHAIMIDTNPNSITRGQQISRSITVLDCPTISVLGFRCYTNNKSSFDAFSEKMDKNLSRKLKFPKKTKTVDEQLAKIPKNISKINLICNTRPTFKKKPEIFEISLVGSVDNLLQYAKEVLRKDIIVSDVFKEGDLVDVSAVTKGKGVEGPVKRFGIKTHGRKAQQMARHTGSLGQDEPGKVRWTVPQAGQTGYQTRTELNKRILKISNNFSISGGFLNYGNILGDYIFLDGCVPGPKKRLIRLRQAIRPKKVHPVEIVKVSIESKQGV